MGTSVDHEPHGAINASGEEKKVVGNLACQHDTYLDRFSTTVCECDQNANKKCTKDEKYEIQLLDTILFPEGGGQPWDHGTLSIRDERGGAGVVVPIRKVLRRKLEAIHYAPSPVPVGTKVDINLDFVRRLDHAQQHSGQHLLSAVLDQLDIPTLAWTMGPELVYVEVPRLPEDLRSVERTCNQYIRDNLPITVTETRERPKNLPEDYDASAGVIRVVSIGGIDANPCCGTHVKSTAELNSLTILHATPIKGTNRNNFRIHFVVGSRCQKILSQVYESSRTMGASLSCQISDIPQKLTVLQDQVRSLMKREKNLKQEMIGIEVIKMNSSLESRGTAFLYRPSGDIEFLNNTLLNLSPPNSGLCILVAGEKEGGPIIIAGEESKVAQASEKLKRAMPHVKGGGKPTRFQGKATTLTPKDIVFLQSLVDA